MIPQPLTPVFDNDNAFQIQKSIINDPQQIASDLQDENNDDGVENTNNNDENDFVLQEVDEQQSVSSPHSPINFIVRKERDGGFLIEADQIPSASSGEFSINSPVIINLLSLCIT